MKHLSLAHLSRLLPIFLLFSFRPSFSLAAGTVPVLTVRESGVYLYSQHDIESPRVATLQKNDTLTPVAEAVGNQTWYLVSTQQGSIGWVRASDVILNEPMKEAFKEQPLSASTWSAQANNGSTYEGTWSVEPDSSDKSIAGTWTLQDHTGKSILHGTWSADKFSTGWNGVWRAQPEAQKVEYSGSWSADFPHRQELRLTDLFEAAAQNAIRGVWTGGSQSGTWAIRAAR
ncbi:MAG: SH3 domain-containing protein [Candidatus Binatia bacterium]